MKVEPPNLIGKAFDVVWQKVNIVADEVRTGGVAWHNLCKDFLCAAIEEDIIARAPFVEVIHSVMHTDLNEFCQSVETAARLHDNIKLAETHTRTIRDVELDAVALGNDNPAQLRLVEEQIGFQVREANKLHVRMSNRAAAHDSIVLEEENLLVLARSQKIFPVLDAHSNHVAHFLFWVGGHIAIALAPLNQYKLVCALYDVVLVLEEDYIAVGVDYVRQMLHVAKRTGGVGVNQIFGLGLAHVRIESHKIYIHA